MSSKSETRAKWTADIKLPEVGRVCVFTSILSDRDYLREIPRGFIEPGVDYLCFTDDSTLRSSSYEVIYIGPVDDGRVASRRLKLTLEHPRLQGYDHYIWLDGTVYVRSKLTKLLSLLQLSGSDLQTFIYNGKRQPWNGLLARNNSPKMTDFSQRWLENAIAFGEDNSQLRDELVFFETLEGTDIKVNLLPISILPYYGFSNHHKDRSVHYRLERRLLSNPFSWGGPLVIAYDFVCSFLLKRDKLHFVRRTYQKLTGKRNR